MSASPGLSSRSFARGLALIALGALAVRVGAAFFYHARTHIGGDAVWYVGVARSLVEGNGFLEPLHLFIGRRVATAAHPPLYPIYLAAVDFTRGDTLLVHRLWSCLPGVGTVVLLGVIGRDLVGARAGLLAAALAAVSIDLFAQDVLLWSEGLFGFTIALTVLAAYRYLRRPDRRHVALLGGAIAVAGLTRAEGALLFVVLLVPLVLRARGTPLARRLLDVGIGAAVALLLMSPWLVYNNTGRFERPVGLSVGLGGLVGSSNCPGTYSGERLGGWGGLCGQGLPAELPEDESEAEPLLRDAGLRYAARHADRLPIVIPVRLLRSFGFYAPVQTTADDLLLTEANAHWVATLAVLQYWVYLALGVAGGVVLFRRRVALLPLVAPVITVAVITVIGYGTMRFRVALDVVLPVVAAVSLDAALTWWRDRGARSQELDADTVAANS